MQHAKEWIVKACTCPTRYLRAAQLVRGCRLSSSSSSFVLLVVACDESSNSSSSDVGKGLPQLQVETEVYKAQSVKRKAPWFCSEFFVTCKDRSCSFIDTQSSVSYPFIPPSRDDFLPSFSSLLLFSLVILGLCLVSCCATKYSATRNEHPEFLFLGGETHH